MSAKTTVKPAGRQVLSAADRVKLTVCVNSPEFREFASDAKMGELIKHLGKVLPDVHIPEGTLRVIMDTLGVEYMKGHPRVAGKKEVRSDNQIRTIARAVMVIIHTLGMYHNFNPKNLYALRDIADDYNTFKASQTAQGDDDAKSA